MPENFIVSISPHFKRRLDTSAVMRLVCVSLLPAAIASVYLFGLNSLFVIVTSTVTCVATEFLCNLAFRRKTTIADGSAAVTGILFAFTLSPTTPLWMVAIGGVLAIAIVKQLFGGLGYNIFNPALAARAILLSSWPAAMTTWVKPVKSFLAFDAVTSASPLGILKEAPPAAGALDTTRDYLDLFLGTVPGSLGETCKIALLIGAVLLFLFKIIDWRIPSAYIGTVAVLSVFFGRNPLAAVLSGGLILGAFFMATDLVTSPTTKGGKLLFGFGCGILTSLIRSWGAFPEGVCYSILFMNPLAPLIDKYLQPRVFGTGKARLNKA
ncbi:MAG: RnfABCDGE type electron transport complex subunit D [Verrucomicrobiota bacterium]|nr:RnfABCDGE type electron transport complex subunit D [Verrucomicrobiota bacterium]